MPDLATTTIGQDSPMTNPGPRAGGPSRRRTFTPTEKLELLAGYDEAITEQKGGAYLREHGVYSSHITEWRKLRDAGVLEGKTAGTRIGKLSAEQAEIARLRRQLEVSEGKRKQTEEALDIMGKLSAFFENAINESQDEAKSKKK